MNDNSFHNIFSSKIPTVLLPPSSVQPQLTQTILLWHVLRVQKGCSGAGEGIHCSSQLDKQSAEPAAKVLDEPIQAACESAEGNTKSVLAIFEGPPDRICGLQQLTLKILWVRLRSWNPHLRLPFQHGGKEQSSQGELMTGSCFLSSLLEATSAHVACHSVCYICVSRESPGCEI